MELSDIDRAATAQRSTAWPGTAPRDRLNHASATQEDVAGGEPNWGVDSRCS